MNINTSKKLFSSYSTLRTNEELYSSFLKLTGIKVDNINEIRSEYNKVICKNFLNESVIKSAFIRKFSIKKSPKNTVTIFELNVGNSRADICMVNGKSMVFEIKTEYDSFNRLENQLNDYIDAFQYVNVVVPSRNADLIQQHIPDFVGIITYTQNLNGSISFKVFRDPIENLQMNSYIQLQSLTKKQITSNFEFLDLSDKEVIIENIIANYSKKDITDVFNNCIKLKYLNKWKYLQSVYKDIYPLDYQWFFKNNINPNVVYK
jgi:hypothetical protein